MNSLFSESESFYGFDKTVEILMSEINKTSWRITAIHDLQKSIKENGKELLPIKVFALCHPLFAGMILENDDERVVSTMMPCRVSVYQKSDGKTYISRINESSFTTFLNGLMKPVMMDSFRMIEKLIRPLLVIN